MVTLGVLLLLRIGFVFVFVFDNLGFLLFQMNLQIVLYNSLKIISPKAQNTQDIIHRPHEAQREGKPKCGCFSSS